MSAFSALWYVKGAEEVISLAANISEGNILESWFLEGKRRSVARTDKDPSTARSVSGPGGTPTDLAGPDQPHTPGGPYFSTAQGLPGHRPR